MAKEASARIKINKLLEEAGWRFFEDECGQANILLENFVRIRQEDLDLLGDDFEGAKSGSLDYLLLDERGKPLLVLEAKKESIHPLSAKEQARKYAISQKCRFIILSNGNLHYFWDLDRGSPEIITAFPKPDSVVGYKKTEANPESIAVEVVEADYVALTQRPGYKDDAGWKVESERAAYMGANKLRFLRKYQIRAVQSLQQAVARGKDRFLFEMATGTGKTLTAAAVIKVFLRSRNLHRVLFLVDRLELEDQAKKAFVTYLANDYTTVVFKENRDDWRRADIVVSTVQSFLFNNKYRALFSPTDFGLVISDEAHRSIGGNARAVFDYFMGYKLGLTATPRDYLKKFESATDTNDPREEERRLLLDTYRTFGCESGEPTFRYSLIDGVTDPEGPFLINPTKVDARTGITTQLLSEQGFTVATEDESGEELTETFGHREFEKKFFAEGTNEVFCKTFVDGALRDPVSGEMGKSIVFAVSQNHAAKLAQILNQIADRKWPGRYNSDFAVQVTSQVSDAQQFTINFAYNKLKGSGNFIPEYKTSKARVCVTVGMMTTGYDCPDILNLGLFRPIFSPTEFIQIKGRGTRRHNFLEELHDEERAAIVQQPEKDAFKLFDFFANCEFFEEEYDYEQVLELPKTGGVRGSQPPPPPGRGYEHKGEDVLATIVEEKVGDQGMRVDRMFFQRFEDGLRTNPVVTDAIGKGEWDRVLNYVNRELFDKASEYYTLDKLRKAANIDRRLSLREIIEKAFGLIPRFKTKDELMEEEFQKFVADHKPEEAGAIPALKTFFKAYISSPSVRHAIEGRLYANLATNPSFSTQDFKAVPEKYRALIPQYIRDYVPLNSFIA